MTHTTRHARLAAALVVACAAAAVAAHGVFASGTSRSSATVYTATLDPRTLVRALDAPPRGKQPTTGDLTVFSATLRSGSTTVGRLEGVSTAIDPLLQGVRFSMLLELRGGSIVLEGGAYSHAAAGLPKPAQATELAVAGGTGTYAGAAGTAKLTDLGGNTQRVELDLR